MRTVKYQIFTFDELSPEAQDKAIQDHITMICETGKELDCEGFRRAVHDAERLQTPWFFESMVYDYCKDEIAEIQRVNEYEFFADGTFFYEEPFAEIL